MEESGAVAADKGLRGARLGMPFTYRWVDQEPTSTTWKDLANKRALVWMLVGPPAMAGIAWLVGGVGLIGFAALFGFWLMPLFGVIGTATVKRQDAEPVPRAVVREVFIEYAEGEFYFVLTADGRAEIYQPWAMVRAFEVADYWPTFGDAGASPYKTGWHAIVMTPEIGAPWCIASTIEAMSALRERHSHLSAKFGADARGKFLRAVAANEKMAHPGDAEGHRANSGSDVPAAFD